MVLVRRSHNPHSTTSVASATPGGLFGGRGTTRGRRGWNDDGGPCSVGNFFVCLLVAWLALFVGLLGFFHTQQQQQQASSTNNNLGTNPLSDAASTTTTLSRQGVWQQWKAMTSSSTTARPLATVYENTAALSAASQRVLTHLGTGPAHVGYVVHVAQQRLAPPQQQQQQQQAVAASSAEEALQALSSSSSPWKPSQLTACYSIDTDVSAAASREGHRRAAACVGSSLKTTSGRQWLVWNKAPFARILCGRLRIPPHTAVVWDATTTTDDNDPPCHPALVSTAHTTVHLFAPPTAPSNPDDGTTTTFPPLEGPGMPPVVVEPYETDNNPKHDWTVIDCNVPCQWAAARGGRRNQRPLDWTVRETPWRLTYTNVDPALEPRAQMERTDYRRDHYYATTSWESSVPQPHFDWNQHRFWNTTTTIVNFETAANAVGSVLNKDCSSRFSRRQKWMAAVAANVKQAHFYGQCQHTKDPPDAALSLDRPADRIALLGQNRIALALEYSVEKYHSTAVSWEAYASGAVPAILGPSNAAATYLPPQSAIFADGFNSWDKFAVELQAVADSKSKWEAYQAWRRDPQVLAELDRKFNFTRTTAQCRTCRWAYAKRYGLGWNHGLQQIQPPRLSRTLCLRHAPITNSGLSSSSTQELVAQPFGEDWIVQAGTVPVDEELHGPNHGHCATPHNRWLPSQPLRFPTVEVDRSIVHHDGVTDVFITNVQRTNKRDNNEEEVILRLSFPHVHNSEGAMFRHVHTLVPNLENTPWVSSLAIQDERVKVTILASWYQAVLRTPPQEEGVVEVVLLAVGEAGWNTQNDQLPPRRLRVITEDVSELHDKITEYFPSSFAKLMIHDFVDPLQVFAVQE